jgi:type I restriction enzyme S subunit
MNTEQLLAHYERIADAPDAVPRLRQFILDLAVRGKLVPQDPNDEPVAELLNRVASEKARLVQAGKIRKPRTSENGEGFTSPFSIPESWQWVRLDTVGTIIGGGTPDSSDEENFAAPGTGIPWLTPADLGGYTDLFISRGARDLSEKGLRSSSATLMPAGTVLFTSRAPIGYVAIASNAIATNQGFKSIVPYVLEMNEYISYFLKLAAKEVEKKASGTTFKEISGRMLKNILLPLPPLEEQKRIVLFLDKLMYYLDKLRSKTSLLYALRRELTESMYYYTVHD